MVRVFTDFSEYDEGDGLPDEWTNEWNQPTWSIETADSSVYQGGKFLRDNDGSNNFRVAATWDYAGNLNDFTLTARIRTSHFETTPTGSHDWNGIVGRASGTAGNESGYALLPAYYNAADPQEKGIYLRLYDSGSLSELAYYEMDVPSMDFVWLQLQCEGSNIRAKAWEDGATVPSDWNVADLSDTSLSSGRVGIYRYSHAEPYMWDRFEVVPVDPDISGTATVDGNPVQGAEITLLDTDNDSVVRVTESDENGEYGFLAPNGQYHLLGFYEEGGDLYQAESRPFVETYLTTLYNEGFNEDLWQEGVSSSNGSTAKNSDHLYVQVQVEESEGEISMTTTESYDLTPHNEIQIDWENVTSAGTAAESWLVVGDTSTNNRSTNNASLSISGGFSRQTDTLDISGLNSEQYVRIHAVDTETEKNTSANSEIQAYGVNFN